MPTKKTKTADCNTEMVEEQLRLEANLRALLESALISIMIASSTLHHR